MEIVPGRVIKRPTQPNGTVEKTVQESPTIVASPIRECYACRANPPEEFREARRCGSQEEAIMACQAWLLDDLNNDELCVYWCEVPEGFTRDYLSYMHPCASVDVINRQDMHNKIKASWTS
ncbi:MAG: hypothetical protein LDL41_11055 [Coleofasciculus sp. S288]|nr:hypothetical protein [Coleofasciculus sp. S288]